MGIRSAFNPLGVLPYTAPLPSTSTITWTVDNIPARTGNYDNLKDAYVLPESWLLGGSSTPVALSDSNLQVESAASDNQHSGYFIITMSYTFPSARTITAIVEENDSNFTGTYN